MYFKYENKSVKSFKKWEKLYHATISKQTNKQKTRMAVEFRAMAIKAGMKTGS